MAHGVNSEELVSPHESVRDANALPRGCSNPTSRLPLDEILFESASTAVGTFRCPATHPAFRDTGPIERSIVVFPRTSVWIRHEGSRSFVADASVATIYNRGQRYERFIISPEGDRCDWFAISDDLARDVAAAFDPTVRETLGPAFRFERVASTPALYFEQRRLIRRLARGNVDSLSTEEATIGIVTQTIGLAYEGSEQRRTRQPAADRRRRELVEHAKVELLRTMTQNRSATDIARALGVSVFHLCRVFRAYTGRTMHDYRTELRVRTALERIGDGTLSAVAYSLGFASHAHLVRVCRRYLGEPPRALRAQLAESHR